MTPLPLENPQMLWLILPMLAVGLYLIKKGAKTGLVESRLIIALLLIIALASPYTLLTKTTMDETPNLVIISDETASMQLFEEGTASRIYEALTAQTPTTIVKVSGDKTSIGDAIVQYSSGDNQIVLVTDGNNNYGKNLEDAFKFAKETGTTVYSVEPELKVNDLSVEIKGDKTVVLGNKNEFDIVVSQAAEREIEYSLEVLVDGKPVGIGTPNKIQTAREETISLSDIQFMSLGAHTIKVTLTPHDEDRDHINNVFYKSIYAVPKPKIHLITDDENSPLRDNIDILYDLSTSYTLSGIDDKKAIVLDNQHIITLSANDIKTLKEYVINGHGLVVVGGDNSYNKGEYLNSSFEELLPVLSKPTEWHGGMYVILILDISGSTLQGGEGTIVIDKVQTTTPTYPLILYSAKTLVDSNLLRDANVGVIMMGGTIEDAPENLFDLRAQSDKNILIDFLSKSPTKSSDTKLNRAIIDAKDILDEETRDNNDVTKYIIIISDGAYGSDLQQYSTALNTAKEMHDDDVSFRFIHIKSNFAGQYDLDGIAYAEKFMAVVDGEYISPVTGVSDISDDEGTKTTADDVDLKLPDFFPLIEYNTKHFITRNIEIAGNITYYNDVTPKAGADRLIITTTGKPVLTTWRYGLGRVASFTTDNGYGGGNRWSSVIYNETYGTPKLISATLNWAIGNPRVEEGAVLEGMDTWFGTPVTLTLTMYDEGVL
ncbi:MAG: hypothetical protein K0A90_09320, partial [Methanosarcinaceae archaeon]|nr:hypothetical protein [Methanosarcinaceae archaeon]